MKAVAAVLFDSGGVLLKHRHAFLDPGDVREVLPEVKQAVFDRAMRQALAWLASQQGPPATEEGAAAQRWEYYRRILNGCGLQSDPARLRDALEGPRWVEPFPEVREVLETLRARGLKLGVLSDGWASTRKPYEQLGLAQFFDAWTFSAVVGCCKPDPRLYDAAARAIGIEPARILFVDDRPDNVVGALRCGWRAVWLNRGGRAAPGDLVTICDLREVLALL